MLKYLNTDSTNQTNPYIFSKAKYIDLLINSCHYVKFPYNYVTIYSYYGGR